MNNNPEPIGLCATCRYVRVVGTRKGASYHRCTLADDDPTYLKYPHLPMLKCAGYAVKALTPENRKE